METFTEWIEKSLTERNWRPADLARAAGIPDATLSRILSGQRNPGPDVCLAVAQAFKEPPEKVFRLAGLLPPLSTSDNSTIQELIDLVRNMTPEDQREVLKYAKYRYREEKS
jgi:transcriptional regulator with XRE-family HTH domain